MFDENSFLSSNIDGALSTRRIPLPVGTYSGFIKEVKARTNVAGKKDATKSYNFLDYVVDVVLTPEAQSVMGTTEASVTRNYSIIVELNDAGTALASGKGKNVQLGKFREAIGQNEDGKPWNPRMPVGKMVKLVITHRTLDDGESADQIEAVTA